MGEFSNEAYRKLEGFEIGRVPPLPDSRSMLINALTSDFAPPRSDIDQEVLDDPDSHLLDRLIAFSPKRPGREEAKLRYHSHIAEQLASDTRQMLENAEITSTFKLRIADEVRRAYAEEKSVSEEVSPERLGLTDGNRGIFDDEIAPEIEAKHLRYFLLGIVGKHLRTPKTENDEYAETTVLHPIEYVHDMQGLNRWITDYINKFIQSPLDELNQRAYLLAVQVFEEMTKHRTD